MNLIGHKKKFKEIKLRHDDENTISVSLEVANVFNNYVLTVIE